MEQKSDSQISRTSCRRRRRRRELHPFATTALLALCASLPSLSGASLFHRPRSQPEALQIPFGAPLSLLDTSPSLRSPLSVTAVTATVLTTRYVRHQPEPGLVKRQVLTTATAAGSCPANHNACDAYDSGVCCQAGDVCTLDFAGHIACCPSSSICTGTIAVSTLSGSTGTSYIAAAGGSTSENGTLTFPSTITNAFFNFPALPTSFPNSDVCVSAVSWCSSEYLTCLSSLGVTLSTASVVTQTNGGVTVAVSGSTIIAAGGSAETSVGASASSAVSLCSSLSFQACGGLATPYCIGFFGGGSASTTASSGFETNAAPADRRNSGVGKVLAVALIVGFLTCL
jgi:hypothetical protein